MRTCQFCAEEIQDAAIVCKHCGREMPTTTRPEQRHAPRSRKSTATIVVAIVAAGGVLAIIANGVSPINSAGVTTDPNVTSAATQRAAPSYDLALIASNGSHEYNFWTVDGQVKNIGTKPIENVQAVTTWYDANGGFIKASDAIIDFNPLLPGQTSPFKTITQGNPAMSKYSVEFKTVFGGTLTSRDDRKK